MGEIEFVQKRLWKNIDFSKGQLDEILNLYLKFYQDLKKVKKYQHDLYLRKDKLGLVPQLGDIEAEITYLRIREYRPKNVFEISPASGWSTSWILQALKDNDYGFLYSFDMVNDSLRTIPLELSINRWELIVGDVRNTIHRIPGKIDYLFIDSDHTDDFARWYLENIIIKLPSETKVSVHDILKLSSDPGWGKESLILCSWIVKNKISCATASRVLEDCGLNEIRQLRKELGIDQVIHPPDYNSMIFF